MSKLSAAYFLYVEKGQCQSVTPLLLCMEKGQSVPISNSTFVVCATLTNVCYFLTFHDSGGTSNVGGRGSGGKGFHPTPTFYYTILFSFLCLWTYQFEKKYIIYFAQSFFKVETWFLDW